MEKNNNVLFNPDGGLRQREHGSMRGFESVDGFIERGGRVEVVEGFKEIAERMPVKPWPIPEWEERRKQRLKEQEKKAKVKTIYYQSEVMDMFDCAKTSDGYRKLDRMIERGDIPPPDIRRSVGRGSFTKRWLRVRLDSFMRLREVASKKS